MGIAIVGTGSYLPEAIVTNDDIEVAAQDYDRDRAGMSLHEWVMDRTGVEYRHRVAPGEGTSDMGAIASQRALADAGIGVSDVDLIVMSTFTSDYRSPNSAGLLQNLLGSQAKFFQIEHACSGFIDAMLMAAALMPRMVASTALVVSSDAVSIYCDPELFMMQTIFGDGAGAVVLRHLDNPAYGIRAFHTGSDGSIGHWAEVPGNGTKFQPSRALLDSRDHYMRLDYKKVYPFAVEKMAQSAEKVIDRAGWSKDDVDWFVPHQTGRNIIEDTARAMGQPMDKFTLCIDHTGNNSGATIPIALDEANQAGLFTDGSKLVLTAIGAGMAWGAVALNWNDYREHHSHAGD